MEAARSATAADLPRLAELWRDARAELGPMRGGQLLLAHGGRVEPVEKSLLADLDDPERGLWVGTIDETVIGYAAGRVEDLDDRTRLGVITELFVEPDARAVGVGEAMMATMLVWFADRRCEGVDAVALPGHRATKNFFEDFGFTARLLVMHHRLDG
ncbi:MAG TPA: GNAT family N-acetyltransferase [Acidimicrobiales bacterium]|nr:GNAT family N-acetyltransferase [Acidimicrobiales bacterium]